MLGCKAALAVLLLAAGGAKAADLTGFAATVRLFTPALTPRWAPRAIAAGVAAAELALGAASLSAPRAGWLNPVVLASFCCFLAVWTVGLARHRGRPCRCFGGLSRRGFTPAGVGRAAGLTLAAAVAMTGLPRPVTDLGAGGQLGLLACGGLVAFAAFSAAAVVGARRDSRPRWA